VIHASATALEPVPLEALRSAARRIRGHALRTPLVRLHVDDAPAEVWLKLENLQPIGSFKIRGAANAISQASAEQLERGVWTASAGNMAQGVGWMARALGIPFTVVVPDHAPETKLAAIRRLGGRIVPLPFDAWWRVIVERQHPDIEGFFVHPVCDPAVMAGNGTIALEILEDLPDVDAVVVPYGGGGLSCGIASGLRALAPRVKVHAAEVETSAALRGALDAGAPVDVPYTPSFVDGIGSRRVLDEMWPLARALLTDSLVVSLDQVAATILLLIERVHVVAEGAGAAPVAAALAGLADAGRIVCIVSGGNLDSSHLLTLLSPPRLRASA
jgi:threonine dehydratase